MAEESYRHRIRRVHFSVEFEEHDAEVYREIAATAQWGGHLVLDEVHPHDNLPEEVAGARLPIVGRSDEGDFLVSTSGLAAELAIKGEREAAMWLHSPSDAGLVVPIERIALRVFPQADAEELAA